MSLVASLSCCGTVLHKLPEWYDSVCYGFVAAHYGEYITYSATMVAVGQGPGPFAGNLTFVCGTTVLAHALLIPTAAIQARKLGCSHTLLSRKC